MVYVRPDWLLFALPKRIVFGGPVVAALELYTNSKVAAPHERAIQIRRCCFEGYPGLVRPQLSFQTEEMLDGRAAAMSMREVRPPLFVSAGKYRGDFRPQRLVVHAFVRWQLVQLTRVAHAC